MHMARANFLHTALFCLFDHTFDPMLSMLSKSSQCCASSVATALAPRPKVTGLLAVAQCDDLLSCRVYTDTIWQVHHGGRKSDHLLRTARYAYWLAKMMHADIRVCCRAALLHDVYSRLGTWSTHGAIAASVAKRLGESPEVCESIVSHMYPIGPAPKSREGWVLVFADKLATATDVVSFVGALFAGRALRVRRMLRATDPFVPMPSAVRRRDRTSRAA